MIKQSLKKWFPSNYNSLGEFIRSLGGYGKYYKWLNDNPIGISKIGRNDTCLCGSGKKYKKCCIKRSKK
jgi:SEC-C motif-containing protein|tara:strand:- start:1709 stop:1915 length:207 start_codon:yes stop_codon:yes gene_type:complete